MASNAIVVQLRSSLLFVPVDGLMSSIIAGYIASSAANALLVVELRQQLVISVQLFCRNDVWQSASDEIFKAVISSFIHEVGQT